MRLRAIRSTVARASAPIARGFHLFRRTPLAVRIVATLAALAGVWAVANWMVQTWRKPTEMFFPVDQALVKSPAATWRAYGPLLPQHSRPVLSPALPPA